MSEKVTPTTILGPEDVYDDGRVVVISDGAHGLTMFSATGLDGSVSAQHFAPVNIKRGGVDTLAPASLVFSRDTDHGRENVELVAE